MLSVLVAVPIASLPPVEGTVVKQQVTYTEQYIEYAYVVPIVESIAEIDESEQLTFDLSCQCAFWLQQEYEVLFSGNANIWGSYINQEYPSRGAIIVLNTVFGHVGMVIDYTKEEVEFISKNWIPCEVTITKINLDDSRILGYIRF